MQFKVLGAMKATGEDIEVSIEADDFMEAQRKANSMGILITRVLPAETEVTAAERCPDEQPKVQLIEQTEKKWKLQMIRGRMLGMAAIPLVLLSVLLLVIGLATQSYVLLFALIPVLVAALLCKFVGDVIVGAAEGNKFWYHE